MAGEHDAWDASLVGFRPLARADFPLMLHWHNTPHVREWWQLDPRTADEIEEKYGLRVDLPSLTRGHVMLYDGQPVGFIQEYSDPRLPRIRGCNPGGRRRGGR